MPTQEERLTALEKTFAIFRKETAARTQEIEENTTIMLGVMRAQGQDIRRIFERLEAVDERLETMGTRLETMDTRLETMDTRLETMDTRLETMDTRLETMDTRLNTIDQRLNRLETKFDEHTTLLTQILARLA
jgi:archaellum component FlaC